jgi:hypothetical protein
MRKRPSGSPPEFVPELGAELSGRRLELWRDPSPLGAKYRAHWLAAAGVTPLRSVPIRVVNLARRPDRRAAVLAAIADAGLANPVEVAPAADGRKLRPPAGWPHGRGAYGCHLSHCRLLVDCVMSNEPVWVWEDDAVPRPGFLAAAAAFWASLPANWEGVYFGGQHVKTPLGVKPGVVRCVDTHRTHCYLVRPALARSLLYAYESFPGHIDNAAKYAQVRHACYAPSPFLVGQGGSWSDIENHHIGGERFW